VSLVPTLSPMAAGAEVPPKLSLAVNVKESAPV
jgi:hypothetical protein